MRINARVSHAARRKIEKKAKDQMNPVEMIIKKRDGKELSEGEIRAFIRGYTDGSIPDYQASAFLMAILCRGMSDRETTDLTLAIAESGEVISLAGIVDNAVDKHSTGGVGDKTTLIVQPILSACGVPVAKMSGRGLGFSGGTIDKLESIPGMRLDLTKEEFLSQLKQHGTVLTGQSHDLAPADGKLYALRDVTGTVPAIPLIASSIMSKKIAAGTPTILLDVKVGNGAFMDTLEKARHLANVMVAIGTMVGRNVRAELSDMNQPLGSAVGNILEVKEALTFLKGGDVPYDLRDHCVDSSIELLKMSGAAANQDEASAMVERALTSGAAYENLKKLVEIQGGNVSYLDQPEKFPVAPVLRTVTAAESGFVHEVHARTVGETSVDLGAGRMRKTDPIDHRVGILVHAKVGDAVEKGMPIFTIHADNGEKAAHAAARLQLALTIKPESAPRIPQFYGIVSATKATN